PGRDYRQGGEDAVAADQVEPGTIGEPQVLAERAIPGMLHLARGANQAAAQQEVQSRLQVREVRDRDEQLAIRREHAAELLERAWLVSEGQVLEDVEAEDPVEAPRAVGERHQRSADDVRGAVVVVDA